MRTSEVVFRLDSFIVLLYSALIKLCVLQYEHNLSWKKKENQKTIRLGYLAGIHAIQA